MSHNRRARIAGVERESFTPQEIADRDGWRCQLCGKRIDPKRKWPDVLSLSIDHVIPLIEQGPHVRANVQATHLTCNIRKKHRGTNQLRLIG